MYTEITPKLSVRKTISHPDDPAKVIGFEARNVRTGRDAVALKGEEVIGENDGKKAACIPSTVVHQIVSDRLELVVLGKNMVWCIDSSDIDDTIEPAGEMLEPESSIEYLPLNNGSVRSFYRFQVEVGN